MRLPVKISCFLLRKKGDSYETALFKRVPERGSFWQQITGGLEESDSSLLFAVKRELKEEASVNESDIVDIRGPFNQFQFFRPSDNMWITEYVFGAILSEDADITIENNPELEHTDYGWYSLDDARKKLKYGKDYFEEFLKLVK